MKRSQEARGDVGGGRDNILGDGLSLFSHCPRMIGFLFAFSSPLFLHSFLLLFCCEALLYFSCVIFWLDLGLCCLSQFVHFVWWKRKFPGLKFSTTVIFLWMGLSLVFICDLFLIGYSQDLTLFLFLSEFPFLFFGWCEFEKDCAAISSKAVQLESLMVKCQRVGSEI